MYEKSTGFTIGNIYFIIVFYFIWNHFRIVDFICELHSAIHRSEIVHFKLFEEFIFLYSQKCYK